MTVRWVCFAMLLSLTPSLALAGGDTYDGADDTGLLGPAFFGFVKDGNGRRVANAEVHITPKAGDPVTTNADILGLYRAHIGKGINPDEVTVSCAKPGFRQESVYRRTPPGLEARFIEVDCTLQAD